MGQRMPDKPIDYGNDCLTGWAAGLTPENVYARFFGIEPCPGANLIPPNGRVFKTPQEDIFPCEFFYDDTVWRVEFQIAAAPDFVWLTLTDADAGVTHFEATVAGGPDEGHVYVNENVACGGGIEGTGGFALVTWTPQATALLEAMVISKGRDLFMEIFPCEDGKLVYKFCRIDESTNIKILTDPD